MTLDFLTPALGDDLHAESPMAGVAARAGGRLEVRDGWREPVSFGDAAGERGAIETTVGFADASRMTKTELHGPWDGLALGTATARDGAWWCPLTETRALVLGDAPRADELDAVDVTTQLCALRIAGPRARDVLARFCALDLRPHVAPPGALRPGSVARTPGLVLVEAEDRLLVLVGAALAEYLWTVVADAASRLGGRPVGTDLLSLELAAAGEAVLDA